MSEAVNRLKELLFDSESKALHDVQQRLDHASSVEREVSERLDAVFSRAGTDDRLSIAVAGILDGALKRAQVARHNELSDAVAPLIVRTIKTEIVNSRDEMVEALYPITGRLVKAYVASAFADMLAQINSRVDRNPLMLRLRSLLTGRSVAELAFADTHAPRITDIYLIRRGTGELIGRWPQEASDDREQVMSGVLAAINEFAAAAFGQGSAALRQIDLDNARVYIRASPIYLLAAKCAGAAPESAQQLIDSAFLSAIEDAGAKGSGAVSSGQSLSRLYADLNQEIAELMRNEQRSRVSPAFVLLCLVGLLFAGWGGWSAYSQYKTAAARGAVESAINATPGLTGYPIDVAVEQRGRYVRLAGLTPSDVVKNELIGRVRAGLPSAMLDDRVSVLPAAHGEIGNAIARAAVDGATKRALRKLDQVLTDLPRLEATFTDAKAKQNLERLKTLTSEAESGLKDRDSRLAKSSRAQRQLTEKLHGAVADLSTLVAGLDVPARAGAALDGQGSEAVDAALALEAASDRLAGVTSAVLHAGAAIRSLPPPPAPVAQPTAPPPVIIRAPDITAFERLSVYVRTHAIFFGDDVKYRDEAKAAAVLDELAKLMRETDAYLRVVGYTDAKGAATRNDELSLARARLVADGLVSREVPDGRIVVVGRQDANRITAEIGETSTNRRVEFELGFDGERVE